MTKGKGMSEQLNRFIDEANDYIESLAPYEDVYQYHDTVRDYVSENLYENPGMLDMFIEFLKDRTSLFGPDIREVADIAYRSGFDEWVVQHVLNSRIR